MALPATLRATQTALRFTDGAYVDGIWIDSAPSSVSFIGHIQPYNPSGREVDLAKRDSMGAEYGEGFVHVYSESQLYTADTSPAKKGDRVTWQGQIYEITEIRSYPYLSLSHYHATGTLVNSNINIDPITVNTVDGFIRAWILAASGLDTENVIYAHQNAPEPSGTYITINTSTSVSQAGMYDEVGFDDVDAQIDVIAYRQVKHAVNIWGMGAMSVARAIQETLDRPTYYDTFIAQNLAVKIEDITDLTALKGRNYEERARFEVETYAGATYSEDADWFNKITYSSDTFPIQQKTIQA